MAKPRKKPPRKTAAAQSVDERIPGLTQKQAHDRVNGEIRAGRMVKPGACAVCDVKEQTWGHHWRGYEYPLDVWWVCSSCNRLLDCHDGSVTLEQARGEMPAKKAGGYETFRTSQAAISRDRAAKGQEIGLPDPPANPERKAACALSFKLFCETYLPAVYFMPWSTDHIRVIAKIEEAVLRGGQFAFAMPRKSGKTTLCESAALWALLYGHRKCVLFIGSDLTAATDSMDTVREQIETNDLLDEDFKEVTKYVRALEGNTNRANGQKAGGKRTRLAWKGALVRLPVIDGAAGSGSVMKAVGITGRIRGTKIGGKRPDLAILDDPQTDDAATSLATNNKLERILAGAVLGLAGPRRKIACFCPCTVIVPGDLADRLLNRDRNPDWQGERMRLLYTFPTATALWDQYATLRADGLRRSEGTVAATALYAANRAAMDAGAVLAWPEKFEEDELSGVQHAMNLFFKSKASFMAEYQNDPLPLVSGLDDLDPETVAEKINGVPRSSIPAECDRLTAFIDCGGEILFYTVCAWDTRFGGSVVDYGTYPPQHRDYFAAADARPKLSDLPGLGALNEDARVFKGLTAALNVVLGRSYAHPTGGSVNIDRCLVDSGKWTKTVADCCNVHPRRDIITPSKGWGMGSGKTPMAIWHMQPGERKPGDHWRNRVNKEATGRLITYDVNYWKSHVARALLTAQRSPGCLTLFGTDPDAHRLFADHLTSEYRSASIKPKSGDQSEQELWTVKPDRRDNHYWDCLVGCAVAASVAGVAWDSAVAAGEAPRAPTVRKKITLSELHEQKHGGGRRR